MYAIYAYIDPPNHPNVGTHGVSSIHGVYDSVWDREAAVAGSAMRAAGDRTHQAQTKNGKVPDEDGPCSRELGPPNESTGLLRSSYLALPVWVPCLEAYLCREG